MQTYQNIELSLVDGIGRIALNRPESRNAISRQMWLDIPSCMHDLKNDDADLIVIEGVGESFAAGADIAELKDIEGMESARENWSAISDSLNFVYEFPLPTIAAIDGPCLGGGCLLACACDLRYASQRSSFAIPVAKLGIALDDANLSRIAVLIGVARTKELIFRAKTLNAEEAALWGLVNEVFSGSEFAARLLFILSEIKANSTTSILESKASFRRIFSSLLNSDNIEAVLASYLGDDFRQRIRTAFKKS